MQTESLPEQAQQNQKNLLRKKQPQKNPQPKSPNLLQPTKEKVDFIKEKHNSISLWIKLLVIFSQIIFIGILTFNSYLEVRLMNKENEVAEKYLEITSQQQEEQQIKDIISKIALHKEKSDSYKLASIAEKTIGSIPQNVRPINLIFTEDSTVVTVETSEPLPVSLLIDQYLKSGVTEEITINSASLNTSTNNFVTNLEFYAKN